MPKKEISKFIRSVYLAVSNTPSTTHEIAERAGTSWESTKNILELLESMGFVQSVVEGSRKKYFRTTGESTETFFNIPVDKKHRNLICFIFSKVREYWKEKTGRELTRTQAQKILVKVNKVCNLDLPVGRYLYGIISPVIYKESTQYTYNLNGIRKKNFIEFSIKQVVDEYSNMSVEQIKESQHEEFNLRAHQIKHMIDNMFKEKLTRERIPELSNLLLSLLVELDDKESIDCLREFITEVNNLILLDSFDDILNFLKECFGHIWEFIALSMFYADMKRFYQDNALAQLKERISQKREDVITYLTELRETVSQYLPEPVEYPQLKKFQGILKR